MCLATPVKIEKLVSRSKYLVSGNKTVDASLIPDAKVGDWLLCHADLAVQKISSDQAQEILHLSKMCYHKHDHNTNN
jgi:hydrogenase assembly chaperone HypC/HupF